MVIQQAYNSSDGRLMSLAPRLLMETCSACEQCSLTTTPGSLLCHVISKTLVSRTSTWSGDVQEDAACGLIRDIACAGAQCRSRTARDDL